MVAYLGSGLGAKVIFAVAYIAFKFIEGLFKVEFSMLPVGA